MSNWKSDRLRSWILGTAATGMLWHSIPAVGDARDEIVVKQKKSVAKLATTQSSAKLRVLAIPSNVRSKNSSIRTVSQNVVTDGGKSEVQRQLEALYQQDGREMPEMNFNLQPINQDTISGTAPGALPPQQPTTPASTARPGLRTNQSGQKPVRPAQGYSQYPSKPQASTYPTQTNGPIQQSYGSTATTQNIPSDKPQQKTVMGLLKKLTASNIKPAAPLSTQAPIPPDFNTGVPGMAGTGPTYSATAPQTQTHIRYPEPARLNTQTPRTMPQPVSKNVTVTSTQNQSPAFVQSVAGISTNATQPPAPTLQLPALAQQPLPPAQQPLSLAIITAPSRALPPLQTEPQPQVFDGRVSIRRETTKTTPSAEEGDFPNPFPVVAESDADGKTVSPPRSAAIAPQKMTAQSESNGKVVIVPKVDAQVTVKVEVAAPVQQEPSDEVAGEPNRIDITETSEDPYAVDAKDFVESLTADSDRSSADPTAPSLEEPASLESPTLENGKPAIERQPGSESSSSADGDFMLPTTPNEPPQEKMQKIHERFGMKGLKGFCPVALRDGRELIDAKPEFFAVHLKQKFHFSSAKAREKFEANPLRYKPAAYGADVVALTQNKDVVEGTLDFAAWYKGRLFLFGSQGNYEIFVKDPAQFATIEGIE